MTTSRTVREHRDARQMMIDAFVEMTAEAQRLGASQEVIRELHGRFFDGNVVVKQSVAVLAILAEVWATPRRVTGR